VAVTDRLGSVAQVQETYVIGTNAALGVILDQVISVNRKLDSLMASQEQLDATVEQIRGAVGTLSTETGELTTAVDRINQWVQAHPDIDTSGLDDAVAQLTASTDAIKAAADAAETAVPEQPQP